MTDSNKFRTLAKNAVAKIEKENYGRDLTHEEIEIVFQSYVLGNMKATLVVARNTQGRYYEVSYSSIANKMYVDVYAKQGALVVEVE